MMRAFKKCSKQKEAEAAQAVMLGVNKIVRKCTVTI